MALSITAVTWNYQHGQWHWPESYPSVTSSVDVLRMAMPICTEGKCLQIFYLDGIREDHSQQLLLPESSGEVANLSVVWEEELTKNAGSLGGRVESFFKSSWLKWGVACFRYLPFVIALGKLRYDSFQIVIKLQSFPIQAEEWNLTLQYF